MDIRDSIKALRNELGKTQVDIAKALHISVGTVSRWELGQNRPNRSALAMLIKYAKQNNASSECVKRLKEASYIAIKNKIDKMHGNLFSVEHTSLEQLIEDASFPIYVCDIKTDEILYVNHITEQQLGKRLSEIEGKKCYEYIMLRDTPCEFCHKNQLMTDCFSGYEAYRRFDGIYYRVFGKLTKWNGHDAQVRYAIELGGSVNIATKNELEIRYEEQLSQRRRYAADAFAVAHYNLTLGTVCQVECRNDEIAKYIVSGKYEDVMEALEKNIFSFEEKKMFDIIRDRHSLIKLYFQGKTHISVKYHIKKILGYFEGSLDLFQNPATYDIEAFATLHNITNETISDAVVDMIMHENYESVMTIDAITGEAHPYRGKHINEVIKEQKKQGDNVVGVKEYLRLHCADADIERVIRETSLPYVKEQLKKQSILTVAYSLRENNKLIYKQTQYSYLDNNQKMILCVMQDISDAYKQLIIK